jgi:hypothetical protein
LVRKAKMEDRPKGRKKKSNWAWAQLIFTPKAQMLKAQSILGPDESKAQYYFGPPPHPKSCR